MALQSSGPISLDDLQTEFGGTNPIGIDEYYRGGGLVPDTPTNSGVPTTGAIAFDDFYGASAVTADVTPDTISWTPNIVLGPGNDMSSTTITGINQTITIDFTATILVGLIRTRKNGGAWNNVDTTYSMSVDNNDVIDVDFTDVTQSGTSQLNGSVTLHNASDGNTLLTTLSVSTYDAGLG